MQGFNENNVYEEYDNELGFSRLFTKTRYMFILVSPDYGCGWSTECSSPQTSKRMLMDARIVRFFIENYESTFKPDPKPMKEFLASLGINEFLGGLQGLRCRLVPKNADFKIVCVDGSERIVM